ncbi:hypothetical protein [Caulobacter sp. S45]|uniref:hypothetical protein n=1 Tax=Caulobacter sp. S45 TaxID=1641861 RepID=UPI0015753236|nr:hypothetical protein [Caulobacter sp. S45]
MKKARALRIIRRLKAAEAEVSGWEGEFLDSVETRLDTYGRAFADPEKGDRDHALSALQQRKLKEIGAKVAGETSADDKPARQRTRQDIGRPGGFTRRKPFGAPRRPVKDDDDDGEAI